MREVDEDRDELRGLLLYVRTAEMDARRRSSPRMHACTIENQEPNS